MQTLQLRWQCTCSGMELACPLQLVSKCKPPPPPPNPSDLPVWAQAIRSRWARTIGSANFCTGVGLEYLLRTMLLLMIWPSLQSSNCNIKSDWHQKHSGLQNQVLCSHLHWGCFDISHCFLVTFTSQRCQFSFWFSIQPTRLILCIGSTRRAQVD